MNPVIIGDCILYLGDCLTILPTLGKVDAVVTDPPYGVQAKLNSKTAKRAAWSISGERRKNAYGTFDDSVEYIREKVLPAFSLALSMSKRAVVTPGNRCFTLYPMPDSFGVFFQPASIGLQRWGRCDSQPILYYGAFPHDARKIPGNSCSFVMTESQEPNGHPCPKPIRAWKKIVAAASLPNETVLDPFMGSGTTGVACVKLGRRFIGIEIEEKYFQIACRRIEDAYRQGDMFLEPPKAKSVQETLALEQRPVPA